MDCQSPLLIACLSAEDERDREFVDANPAASAKVALLQRFLSPLSPHHPSLVQMLLVAVFTYTVIPYYPPHPRALSSAEY